MTMNDSPSGTTPTPPARNPLRQLDLTSRQLDTILNASSESIWICDGEGVVLHINRATEKLLGISADEVVGRNVDDLVEAGFMDRSVSREVLQRKCRINILQQAPKTDKQLLVTGTPVFESDGSISMVVTNERDMTRLNQLQEALTQARIESSRIRDELTQLNLKELQDQEIVAHSKEMQEILLTCRRLAQLKIDNILLLGESGTGKGLLAKFIHAERGKGPFVQINCAALPETLVEAELFGYEKGAFTGAGTDGKMGLFEMAKGGTLFLDEIGEMSLPVQAKLLKCLEDKEVLHIGGLRPIPIDCTVIAATNVDLNLRISEKTFRQDLFFRLNTFSIQIPPLRDRPEDILGLCRFFLKKFNTEYGLDRRLSAGALNAVQSRPFPGNVRELQNLIQKAVVMDDESTIMTRTDGRELEEDLISCMDLTLRHPDRMMELEGDSFDFNAEVMRYEKLLLRRAIRTHKSTRAIADALHMSQSQVFRKLKKLGLSTRDVTESPGPSPA